MVNLSNLNLDEMLLLLPNELVERHGLEEMAEDQAREKALSLLEKRAKAGFGPIIGYHTTSFEYGAGDEIKPYDHGRAYFSLDKNALYLGDQPKNCYVVVASSATKDDNATDLPWAYTRAPLKVVGKLEGW